MLFDEKNHFSFFEFTESPPGTFKIEAIDSLRYKSTYGTIAPKLHDIINSIGTIGRVPGQNPIAILIPSHRVVGSDHSLTGYSGRPECKEWLRRHGAALLM